ncbi:MAG: hypothetical protein ACI85V_001915, partial [bacterium]
MQAGFAVAVPRIAVVETLGQDTRSSNGKAAGQLAMDMLEIGAAKLRVKLGEPDFRHQILARLFDIAIIGAQPVAARQVIGSSIGFVAQFGCMTFFPSPSPSPSPSDGLGLPAQL